jgi:hypothetical protein
VILEIMTEELFFEGARYISAAEAAGTSNLTRDYIARLAREGKLAGKQVGRQWYVSQESLHTFLVTQEYANAQRRDALVRERQQEYGLSNGSGSTEQQGFPKKTAAQIAAASLASGELYRKLMHAVTREDPQPLKIEKSKAPAVSPERSLYRSATKITSLHKVAAAALALVLVVGLYTAQGALSQSTPELAVAAAASPLTASTASIGNTLFQFANSIGNDIQSFFSPFTGVRFAQNRSSSGVVTVNIGSLESPAQTPPTTVTRTITRTVVENPIIERIAQNEPLASSGGVTESELDQKLQQLNDSLTAQIVSATNANSTVTAQNYNVTAQTNAIDQLYGTTITNPSISGGSISNSGISGGTIAGATISDATFSGTTTVEELAVSGSATSTFGGSIDLASGCFSVSGTCIGTGGAGNPGGSNTQVQFNENGVAFGGSPEFTFSSASNTLSVLNASTSNATTTNLYVSGQTTLANALSVTSGGTGTSTTPGYGQLLVGNASGGFDLLATSSLGISGGGGTGSSDVSTSSQNIWSALQVFAANASTSEFTATSSVYFTSITNSLLSTDQNGQVVATTSIGTNLLTGTLGIGNGGTGVASTPAFGQLLVGNSSGGYTLTSTSSLGIAGSSQWVTDTNGVEFTTGNVGIGTQSSSSVPLLVKNTSAGNGSVFGSVFFGQNSTGDKDAFNVRVKDNITDLAADYIGSPVNTNLTFSTRVAGGPLTEQARIDSSGDFGIGTTSPGSILAVTGVGNFVNGATSTLYNGLNLTSGCFSINGVCVGSGSGSSNVSTSSQNTWSALQIFAGNASSSNFSNFGIAYFGGSATSSFNSAGQLTLAGLTNSLLSVNGSGQVVATSTIGNGQLQNSSITVNGTPIALGGSATISAASSTLLANNNTWTGLQSFANASDTLATLGTTWFSGLSNSILAVDQNGKVIATSSIGTNLLTGTLGTINGNSLSVGGSITVSAASSTLLANNNTFSGINSFTGNTTFANATSTNFFSTTASSTNLFAQSASFGSLSLGSALSIANGGTNATSFTSGQLLSFDGTRFVSTSTIGNNQLANASITINGTPIALGGSATITAASSTLLSNNNTFSGNNIFSGGDLFLASTTIGNGTQAGGLTINGGATTTGNALVAGAFNVTGQTTLSNASTTVLSISSNSYLAAAHASTFNINSILSCGGGEALQTDASGNIGCGTIATGGASSGGGWTTNNVGSVALSTSTDNVAIGATSTPYAKLSIVSSSVATTTLALVPVAGQNANILDIYTPGGGLSSVLTAAGNLGLGTTTPGSIFSVQGVGNFVANATSTLYNGLNLTSGCFSINGTCLGSTSASSTLLTDNNTFSGNSLFSASTTFSNLININQSSTSLATFGSLYFSSLPNAVLSTNASGQVVATTSVGTNYLTGTLGTVNGQTLSVGGSITVSAASSTLLANNNSWTGLNSFANASSTLTTLGTTWFSGLASAVLAVDQNGKVIATSTIGTNLLSGNLGTINSQPFSVGGSITISAASSTLLANNNTFSGNNTFSLINLSATSSSLLATDANGNVIATTTIGTNLLSANTISGVTLGNSLFNLTAGSGLSGTAYNGSAAQTFTLNLANANNWTGLQTFQNASSSNLSVFTNAYFGGSATSSFNSAGQLTLAGLTNSLLAVNGSGQVVATSTIGNAQLANSSITINSTPIALGGSATITAASSTLLTDNNTFSGSNIFSSLLNLTNGFISSASSTIGSGTQTGGLTISGGATTTGNAYFSSTLGVGTTSPSATLAIAGGTSSGAAPKALAVFGGTGVGNSGTGGGVFLKGGLGGTNGSFGAQGGNIEIYGGAGGNGSLMGGSGGDVYIAAGSGGSLAVQNSNLFLGITQGSSSATDGVSIGTTTRTSGGQLLVLGSVGIGTTTPNTILSIDSTANFVKGATSTVYTGLSTPVLSVTSSTASSTFANGINLTSGCVSINGTCLVTGVSSVSNSDGTLSISPTSGAVTASLALGHANSWTGLQQFSNASTSLFSAYGPAYFGASATSSFNSAGQLTLANLASAVLGVNSSGQVVATSTIGNSLLTNSGALTVSAGSGLSGGGSVALGGSTSLSLNLTNANNWTGLQSFQNASSTVFSNFGIAYFGGSATSSFNSAGQLTLAGLTNSLLSVNSSGQVVATSTIGNGQLQNSSITINGTPIALGGSATVSAASSTLLSNNNTFSASTTFSNLININQASTSLLTVSSNTYLNLLNVTGNTTLANATSTNFFSTVASSTNLFAQTASLGALTVGNATSTFGNGINLSAGCFSINGTCLPTSSGGSGTVSSGTQGQFAFYAANGTTVSGTSTLFVTQAGNIGVGTTTPGVVSGANKYLTIASTGAGTQPSLELAGNTNVSGNSIGRIDFYNQNGSDEDARIQTVIGSDTSLGSLTFSTDQFGTLNEVARFDPYGDFGLGTTTPGSILSVQNVGNFVASATSTLYNSLAIGTNLNLNNLASAVLGVNSSGQVVATSTIGTNLLSGTLATINGTTIAENGTYTIAAASSTLLSDNNTFSASTTFSNLININQSSTSLATLGTTFFSGLTNALLSTNQNGQVVATSTIGNSLLTNSGALTVSAGSGLSGGGSVALGGSTSLSLNLTNANNWTGLQSFSNSSSTLATITTGWATNFNATYASSTALTVSGNTYLNLLNVTGNTTLANATSTNFFSTVASSTNLFAQTAALGSLTLGTALPIASGGTNAGSYTSGQLLSYNGTSFVSTSTIGNNQLANSSITFASPNSTLSVPGSISLGGTANFDLSLTHSNWWTATQNFTNASTSELTATSSVYLTNTEGAILTTNSGGLVQNYAGTTCTNQFVRSLSGAGAATCNTVANTDLAHSTIVVNGTTLTLGDSADTITAASSTLLANNNTFSGNDVFSNALTVGNLINSGITANTLLYGNGSKQESSVTLPGYLTLTSGALAISQLPIAQGGTNATSQTTNGVTYFNGTAITSGSNLTFNSSGTLFVGTSTPSTSASLYVTATTSESGSNFLLNVASSTGASLLNVNGNGDVGIGTTTPSANDASVVSNLLTISKDFNGNTQLDITNFNNGSGAQGVVHFTNDIGGVAQLGFTSSNLSFGAAATSSLYLYNATNGGIGILANNTNGSIRFAAGGTTEQMRLTPTGSLGIGTTTPGSIFSIQNVGNFVASATSTLYQGLNLTSGCFSINGTCVGGSGGGGSGTVSSGTQGQFAFYNANGTTLSGTSTIFASQAGNIGIGTTSPFEQLTVLPSSANISRVSQTSLTNNAGDSVYVQGNYAYIAEGSGFTSSFEIYDISNPASPTRVSQSNMTAFDGPSIYVQGKYAYIVNGGQSGDNGFDIFDVSNPSAPILVNQTALNTGGQSTDSIYVQGRYAYIAEAGLSSGTGTNAFEIYDVSNPYSIKRVSQNTLANSADNGNGGPGIYVQGNYAYIAEGGGTTNAFEVWNISNPAAPTRVSQSALADGSSSSGEPDSVYVQGRYAYIAEGTGTTHAFEIFDISNPASPTRVSQSNLANGSGSGGGDSISVQGRYAYIAEGGGTTNAFQVFDVSNPATPFVVSGNNLANGALGGTTSDGLFVSGRYAYIAEGGGTTNAFEVFDLGGSYIQQGEFGTLEAGTLVLRNNLTALDGSFEGGLTVGSSLAVTGSASFVSATSTIGTTANIFSIATASSTNPILTVLGNGNIGIGTSTPTDTLHIEAPFPQLRIDSSAASGGFGQIKFEGTGSSRNADAYISNEDTGQLYFRTAAVADGPSIAMTITNAGKVGIGTTTPWGQLAVSTSGQQSGTIPLFNIASTTNASLFTVLGNGNVGIGSSTPMDPFDVSGAIPASTQVLTRIVTTGSVNGLGLALDSSGTGNDNLGFARNGVSKVGFTYDSRGFFGIADLVYSASDFSFRIGDDGSLSYVDPANSSAVRFLLSHAGSLTLSSGLTSSNTGDFLCINTSTFVVETGTTCTLSSEKVKNSIATSSAGLAAILQLNPVTFKYDQGFGDNGSTTQVGLIAEQVATVNPLFAEYANAPIQTPNGTIQVGDPDGINWNAITDSLVNAVQDIGLTFNAVNATTTQASILSFYQGTSTPAVTIDQFGNLSIGTSTATSTTNQMLCLNGSCITSFPFATSTASSTPSFATDFLNAIFAQITLWLSSASNGIHDVYATVFHAQEVDTQLLCVSDSTGAKTCITKAQLDALIAGAGASQSAGSSSGASSSGSNAAPAAPVISINGNNPATIDVGAIYNDLGATITGPTADLNLGISASVDGGATTTLSSVAIDTSAAGTHTIVYSATDQNGLTSTATRTVNVVAPQSPESGSSASSTSDTSGSTTSDSGTGDTGSSATSSDSSSDSGSDASSTSP